MQTKRKHSRASAALLSTRSASGEIEGKEDDFQDRRKGSVYHESAKGWLACSCGPFEVICFAFAEDPAVRSDMWRPLKHKGAADGSRAACAPLVYISLILLLSVASQARAYASDLHSAPVSMAGPASQFAIADFDGDLHPDLASIEAGGGKSGSADYRIQLRLSSVGRQFIQLTAPRGGLIIEARDVNGDHAVDLVLATAWSGQPVAVFLNDGHGSFSRAEPDAFPKAFASSSGDCVSTTNQGTDAVCIPPQPGSGICAGENDSRRDDSLARFIRPASNGLTASPLLISHAGRAPPSDIYR